MTADEAVEVVRGMASAGRILLTGHALERMRQRRVQFGDVRHALRCAEAAIAADGERWKVRGPDLDGDELHVVVVIEDDLIVVTLF